MATMRPTPVMIPVNIPVFSQGFVPFYRLWLPETGFNAD
jgi:hypothetical protein